MKLLITIFLCIHLSVALDSNELCTCSDACNKKSELGKHTWYLLHEIAKSNEDTKDNRYTLGVLMESLSYIYPCAECRPHIWEYLQEHNPEMTEEWMCHFHNDVNARLDKPLYPCDDPTPASEPLDFYDTILDMWG